MSRCPQCGAPLEGGRCGRCVPPHRALLDPATPQPPAEEGEPKGWLERLEAARKTTPGLVREAPASPPPPPDEPPPLPAPPAHRLLTRLEGVPAAAPPPMATEDLDALGSVDVAAPPVPAPVTPTRRWVRDLVWGLAIAAVVGVGAYGAFRYASAVQVEAPAVAPELEAKRERALKARKALERGHQALLERRVKAAVAAYREALELKPTLASAERGLGIAFTRLERSADAIAHYRRYLELAPDADDAGEVRGLIRELRRARRR